MSLHHLRVCVLLVGVTTSFGIESPIQSSATCRGSILKSGDIVKKQGDNVEKYKVQTCLGKGQHGEVWTLHGSDHLLKFQTSPHVSSECLFGKIAAQKDPAHFVNCFDHGSAEVWSVQGSNLVRKQESKGGYTVWQRADGQKLAELIPSSKVKDFKKVFPDLNSVLDHLNQFFHMFDALQKPGTIAPGIGVRQWPDDVQAINIFASADRLTLIDYGMHKKCCDGRCAVESGFEDAKIEPCYTRKVNIDFESRVASRKIIEIMLSLALAFTPPSRDLTSSTSDWFKRLHNTSLESLVTELRSSSGPSREMFRNQWCLQNAKVIQEMASWLHKRSVEWPPFFMESVKIALGSVPSSTPIVQGLLDVDRKQGFGDEELDRLERMQNARARNRAAREAAEDNRKETEAGGILIPPKEKKEPLDMEL